MRERGNTNTWLQFQSPWHRILAAPGPFLFLKKRALFIPKKCVITSIFHGGLNLGSSVGTYIYTEWLKIMEVKLPCYTHNFCWSYEHGPWGIIALREAEEVKLENFVFIGILSCTSSRWGWKVPLSPLHAWNEQFNAEILSSDPTFQALIRKMMKLQCKILSPLLSQSAY